VTEKKKRKKETAAKQNRRSAELWPGGHNYQNKLPRKISL